MTNGRYVLRATKEHLREDMREDDGGIGTLSSSTDPVLAELWDNRKDAEYDRL